MIIQPAKALIDLELENEKWRKVTKLLKCNQNRKMNQSISIQQRNQQEVKKPVLNCV